jgi:3-hydroxyisobutyrate dehydrogenase
MGGRMALRIAAAGHQLTVHDPRPDAVAQLTAAGARAGGSSAAVVAESEVCAICVVDDRQLRAVVEEARPCLDRGKTLVVHSSVAPATMREIEVIVAASGAAVVDAPVSGSRPAADRGELTVLVGGRDADIDRVEHLLRACALRIVRVGAVGAAQAMKITNNVMLHMNHLIALEALRFARSQGLSEAAVIDAVNISSGRSWVTETWGLIDDMMRDHPQAGSPAIFSLMSKELWQSVSIARQDLTSMPLTAVGTQVSRSFFEERLRELESSAGEVDGAVGITPRG